MNSLIIATGNKHKFLEIESCLREKQINLPLTSLADHVEIGDLIENCYSFDGNALKKAKTVSVAMNTAVLADDSGLSVNALDGKPGVFSARYAGEPSKDDRNNHKLLQALRTVPDYNRQAKFICSMVLYLPSGVFYTSHGELPGVIIGEYRGTHGFGYDPLFYMPEKNATLAEIPHNEKIKFSHRTRALENLLKLTNHFAV